MIDKAELEDVDRYYVERISRHIDFPNNDKSLKLFRQYRNKIMKKQISADNRRFRKNRFLAESYLQFSQGQPSSTASSAVDAMAFAKHVLGAVLEIIAYRDASMSFMLQIYENGMKLEPRKNSKPNLKLIK